MKTLYKKLIIIGVATVLLEAIIVYFLYTSINAFYTDLTNKIAYMLTEQVKNVIISDKFDITRLSQYNKYPIRRLITRFSREDSKILSLLLIDSSNKIIVSSDPSVEGQEYTAPEELALLDTDAPQVVNRKWEGDIQILDVIWPLKSGDEIQGYLRSVISVKHLQNFYRNRQTILILASVFTFGIILFTVLLTSRIYQAHLKEINTAIDQLSESNFEYRPEYSRKDEFAPVFSGLSKLYEKTVDLTESYQQSEKRIQTMMKVIHEGLLIIDMNMKIVTYNEYLLELLNIKKTADPERKIYEIMHRNPRMLEVYRRAKDPMTHSVRKILTLSLDGDKKVDVQLHAMLVSDPKKESGIIFYIKNLGMLQELEQNLHRSMKYGLISQLASGVGHEIRNPLSSLAIHTEIVGNMVMKADLEEERREKIKKSLGILNSEIDRLHKLIDQFINLAKAKEVRLDYENVNELICEVTDLVQHQAYEKHVNIHRELSENLPMVNMSKDQMKQVIINLILNSFDAMPEGGELYLRTTQQERRVVISIEDTGKGIPRKHRDQIFDLDFSTKRNGGGIGLALSRKIVEAHEGKIYFESEPGVGTIFFIELPIS